jgi:hypothetical protein
MPFQTIVISAPPLSTDTQCDSQYFPAAGRTRVKISFQKWQDKQDQLLLIIVVIKIGIHKILTKVINTYTLGTQMHK